MPKTAPWQQSRFQAKKPFKTSTQKPQNPAKQALAKANPKPTADLGPNQDSLAFFFAQALQKKDWQQISLSLDVGATTHTFSREEAQKILDQQITAKATPGQIQEIAGDPQIAGQFLLKEQLRQIEPSQQQTYLAFLANYQQGLKNKADKINQEPLFIPSLSSAQQAFAVQQKIKPYLDQVAKAVEENIPIYYPKKLKEQLSNEMAEQISQQIVRQLALEKPVDEQTALKIIKTACQQPRFDAALSNKTKLAENLQTASQSNPLQAMIIAQNFNLQLSDPAYYPLSFRLIGSGLTPEQTKKVIEEISPFVTHGLIPGASNYAVQDRLRSALTKYKDHLKISPDTLALEFAHFGQAHKLASPQVLSFAKQLGVSPLAAQAYLTSTKPELFEKYGLSQQAREIKNLEERLSAKTGLRTIERKAQKTREKWQKIREYQKRRQEKITHFYGQTRRGRALVGWHNFKQKIAPYTPLGLIHRTNHFMRKQVGNLLIKGGMSQAGNAFMNMGFKGLALNILNKATLGKLLPLISKFTGPIGTALGTALTFAKPENFKLLLQGLGAGLYAFLQLLASFPTAVVLTGAGMAFLGPPGAAAGAILGYGIDSTVGAIKAATTGAKVAAGVGSDTAALGAETAASTTFSGSLLGSLPGVAVFGTIAAVTGGAIFFVATVAAILAGQPSQETGGGIDYPVAENTVALQAIETCQDPGCRLANLIKECGLTQVTQDSWKEKDLGACLLTKGVSQEVIDELYHSVFELEDNENLQCVGFKIAAEKMDGINLPRQNAVSFLTTDYENNPGALAVGANAVWGPRAACVDSQGKQVTDRGLADSMCEDNIYCCGHLGIVSKINDDGSFEVVSAWGDTGNVNITQFQAGSNKESGGPWQYLNH